MEKNPTMLFVVAAALIRPDGKICLQKRPKNKAMAGLWEFPGGKVEADEAPAAALARELDEELGIGVESSSLTPLTFASQPLANRNLLLLLYTCHHWDGEVSALESPELGWFLPSEMKLLQMPPADGPFIDALTCYLERPSAEHP